MNFIGILASIIFVFLIIGISGLLEKKKLLSKESSRKFVHIGVSNWWILAMLFFDNNLWAAVVPALFIVLNYISYKKNIFKSMERGAGKKDLGTVYFAVSLFILSIMTFTKSSSPFIGAMGILIMGYGDGFAAIIGGKYGKHSFKIADSTKSLEGSAAMFVFSFLVSLIIMFVHADQNFLVNSFIIAAVAMFTELFSVFGLDNLTVPLITSYLYYLLSF